MKRRLTIFFAAALFASSLAAQTRKTFATDTFVRANATTLGLNWTEDQPQSGGNSFCQIVGNHVQNSLVTSNCFAAYWANDFPDDQFSQVTNGTKIGAASLSRSCVHMVFAGGLSLTGYCINLDGGGTHYAIDTVIGGTFGIIFSTATTPAQGDVILLQVQKVPTGQQLTLFINAVQVGQVIDTTNVAPTGAPGLSQAVDGTITDATITNWIGGSVSQAPTVLNSVTALNLGAPVRLTNPTAITTTGQAVAFVFPVASFQYLGRLQLVADGQVSNPTWVLECNQNPQDGANALWFSMPAMQLPSLSQQLGDLPPVFSVFYDLSGLSAGTVCRFGLATVPATSITPGTVITGNVNVWALIG